MALSNRISAPSPSIHGSPCSVGQFYRDQAGNEPEIVALNAHLYEYGLNAGQLISIFIEEHVPIRRDAINKHRYGKCRCFTIDRDVCCDGCRRDFAHCTCDAA